MALSLRFPFFPFRSSVLMLGVAITPVLLAACGGSGGPPSAMPATAAPEPPEELVYSGGYFYGNLYLDDAASSTYPIQIVMSEDFHFRALQIDAYSHPQTHLLLRGDFSLEGQLIDGEGVAIAGAGKTWSGGASVTALSYSGTRIQPSVTSDGQLLITVSMASGDTGRIEAEFGINSGYGRGSSLEHLEGHWGAAQGADGSWENPYGPSDSEVPEPRFMRIDVADDGEFSGADDDGCVLAGRFSLIDPKFGLWSVDYTQSGCDRDGSYSGLALRDNGWYETPSLYLSADDGSRSQSLEFWKQE